MVATSYDGKCNNAMDDPGSGLYLEKSVPMSVETYSQAFRPKCSSVLHDST